jgi:putative restriction endonuclease
MPASSNWQRSLDRKLRLLKKISTLKMWSRGGKRAPHKPLLFLYALGKFADGQLVLSFEDVARDLGKLLHEFGPTARRVHPEYPFWRLQRDGLWEVHTDGPVVTPDSNADPKKSELKRQHAKGKFPSEVIEVLQENPTIIREAARVLLTQNFPETIHKDIAAAVGLPMKGSRL